MLEIFLLVATLYFGVKLFTFWKSYNSSEEMPKAKPNKTEGTKSNGTSSKKKSDPMELFIEFKKFQEKLDKV